MHHNKNIKIALPGCTYCQEFYYNNLTEAATGRKINAKMPYQGILGSNNYKACSIIPQLVYSVNGQQNFEAPENLVDEDFVVEA